MTATTPAAPAPASPPTARRFRTPPAVRVLERYLIQYRRNWILQLYASGLTPFAFLLAMGFGLGPAIDRAGNSAGALGGVSYAVFLAPGLLAAAAMQAGAGEAAYPLLTGFKWMGYLNAAANTELNPSDLFDGVMLWNTFRLLISNALFVIVMALFGLTPSWWVLAAIPVGTLCGLAFVAPVAAWTATMHDEGERLSLLFRLGIMPLFLFSGSFLPVSQLPAAVRWFAYLTPTWHGVEACRMLALGRIQPAMLALHLAVLAGCIIVGTVIGHRTFTRRQRS